MSQTVEGPTQLTLTSGDRREHSATVADASGQTLITFQPTGERDHQQVTIAGETFRFDSHAGMFKLWLEAVGPGDERLLRLDGKARVLSQGGGTFDYAGESYELRIRRRSLPVPWVLTAGEQELAAFTRHAADRRIDIAVSAARPVPLLVVATGCAWNRLWAAKLGNTGG